MAISISKVCSVCLVLLGEAFTGGDRKAS